MRAANEKRIEEIIAEEGQTFLGWRTVPTDNAELGTTAVSVEPVVRQLFIGRSAELAQKQESDALVFERKLYVIRKRAENEIKHGGAPRRRILLRAQPLGAHHCL